MAVKGRHGCQRPQKQERRRAGKAKTKGAVIKFERILSTAPFVHAPGGARSLVVLYFFQNNITLSLLRGYKEQKAR
ncbi:hypothetical protein [Selenomonas ruminantium]|uniref:hypothetical protein n=1 Tax=Selenomonas ruminantium TaxID=971 RepID=UPI00040F866E|nr:hypothetical protein [Selenomonas ruminantium]